MTHRDGKFMFWADSRGPLYDFVGHLGLKVLKFKWWFRKGSSGFWKVDRGDALWLVMSFENACASIEVIFKLQARRTIAMLGQDFILHGTTVLTHGFSRVVLSLLKMAAANGKQFNVICTGATLLMHISAVTTSFEDHSCCFVAPLIYTHAIKYGKLGVNILRYWFLELSWFRCLANWSCAF